MKHAPRRGLRCRPRPSVGIISGTVTAVPPSSSLLPSCQKRPPRSTRNGARRPLGGGTSGLAGELVLDVVNGVLGLAGRLVELAFGLQVVVVGQVAGGFLRPALHLVGRHAVNAPLSGWTTGRDPPRRDAKRSRRCSRGADRRAPRSARAGP